jgi:hypothetical protein
MKILHEVYNEPGRQSRAAELPKNRRLWGARSTKFLISIRREAKASAHKIHYYHPHMTYWLDGLLLDLLEFRKRVYRLDSTIKISQLMCNWIH